MLKRIRIRGYKSLDGVELELDDLTVVVVLIHDGELAGAFESQADAINIGYQRLGASQVPRLAPAHP